MDSKWMPIICIIFGLLMLAVLALESTRPVSEYYGNYEIIEDGLKRFTNNEVTCYLFEQGVDCNWK